MTAQAAEAMEVLDKILGCSQDKGRGIAFTIPIDSTIGICKEN